MAVSQPESATMMVMMAMIIDTRYHNHWHCWPMLMACNGVTLGSIDMVVRTLMARWIAAHVPIFDQYVPRVSASGLSSLTVLVFVWWGAEEDERYIAKTQIETYISSVFPFENPAADMSVSTGCAYRLYDHGKTRHRRMVPAAGRQFCGAQGHYVVGYNGLDFRHRDLRVHQKKTPLALRHAQPQNLISCRPGSKKES